MKESVPGHRIRHVLAAFPTPLSPMHTLRT